jgi:competence ComEA-like helix-hairpin-helix protein
MYWGMNRREMHGLIGLLVLIAGGLATQAYVRTRDPGAVWVEHASGKAVQEVRGTSSLAIKSKAWLPDGRLDLNRASMEELDALPRIGPVRARAILDYRERQGGLKSIEDLLNVAGLGAKTVQALEPLVCVPLPEGKPIVPASVPQPTVSGGAATAAQPLPEATGDLGRERVNINTATVEQLAALWNIGPAKAAEIVSWRRQHGPFRRIKDLTRVKGIGEETLRRNQGRIDL